MKGRLDLVGKAQKAGVEVRDDMADDDIKKAVILKKFPTAKLDGVDQAYLAARFDCACEQIDKDAENQSHRDAADNGAGAVSSTAQEQLDAAKKRYNARMDSAWQDNNPNNKEA